MRSRFLLSATLILSFAGACASRPAPIADHHKPKITDQDEARAAWRKKLAARRQDDIQRLHDYWVAGQFPVNRDADGMLNVFVDDQGHLCAVANLLKLSGQDTLVAQTAEDQNFIVLRDVHDGPLMGWMLTSGLTQEEIALIQEPYEPYQPDPLAQQQEIERLQRHFKMVERQLREDSDQSLDVALDRLAPRLAAGDLPSDA